MNSIGLNTPESEARVYVHGAHVTHFQPRGQKPVLFLSREAVFQENKAIRGGVPICFPWFGPGMDPLAPQTPAHGTARLCEWTVEQVTDHSTVFSLELLPWRARFSVEVGAALKMTFEVCNVGSEEEQFEEALHTYLAVSDIRNVTLKGLENTEYLDNTAGLSCKRQGEELIRFTGETDRVYLNTQATCVVTDPSWNRRLIIEKTGSDTTVVWNPWIERAKTFKDLNNEEWPSFLCVETCNVKQHAKTLAPGQRHIMEAVIRVESL